MAGAPRKNIQCIIKTFRFNPELVADMERVIYLTQKMEEGVAESKYSSMTALVMAAITRLVKEEKGKLEKRGVVWEHLTSNFSNPTKE